MGSNIPRSVPQIIQRLKRNTTTVSGHWRCNLYRNKEGYPKVKYKGIQYTVSRFSAHVYLGLDLTSKMQALHKRSCPYKDCWNPDCLYVGTPLQNVRDLRAIGNFWGKKNAVHKDTSTS